MKIIINTILSFIISIFCCFVFMQNLDSSVTLPNIMNAISTKWLYLLIACILLICSVLLRSLRWKLLFHHENNNIIIHLYKAQFISYFINNISPIRIGDLAKSYVVAKNTKKKTSYILGSIIMERFLDIIMVFLFLFILIGNYGLAYFKLNFSSNIIFSFFIFSFFLFIIFKSKFFYPVKLQNIINELWNGFTAIQIDSLLKIFIYSFLIWIIYLFDVYLIQLIFPEISLSLLQCLLILVVSSFIQMLPIGFGAIGIFHIGLQGVFTQLNIINYESFIFVIHLYSYVIYTIIGAYYFFHEDNLNIKTIYSSFIKA